MTSSSISQPKHLVWITDPHLDFLSEAGNGVILHHLLTKAQSNAGSSIVITGDIAEAPEVHKFMEIWKQFFESQGVNLYFVLGNHDYYRGRISEVREKFKNGPLASNWLPSAGIISLTPTTALIGHDGWYDGLYADYFLSKLNMADYMVIWELSPYWSPTIQDRFNMIRRLAFEGATYVYKTGTEALKTHNHLYVATHVPPFPENSLYKNKISDNHWLPHFSSKLMGDALLRLAKENPTKKITCLCGHSHHEAYHSPLPNLEVYTGKAEYRLPQVNDVFMIL